MVQGLIRDARGRRHRRSRARAAVRPGIASAIIAVALLTAGAVAVVAPAGAVVACSSTVPAAMEPSNTWGGRGPVTTVWANPTGLPWPLTPADFDAAVRQATAEWDDDPDSAIAFTYGGLSTDHAPEAANDGYSQVYWDVLPAGTVAATSLYAGPFGSLAGFDTAINRTLLFSGSGYDLTTTIRHELGHGIGLCHDSERAELMYPTQAAGAAGVRGLTPRALAEVRRLYPNQELTTVVDDGSGPPTVVRTGRNALYARSRDPATDTWAAERAVGPNAPPPGISLLGTAGVGRDPDGRLELFVVGSDGGVYQSWQLQPGGGFTPWSRRGAGARPGIALGRNRDGRLELFANGIDGVVRASWQDAPGGPWVEWSDVPGVAPAEDGTAAATNQDGRLELFALDGNGALWHRWQIDAGRGPWTEWLPITSAPATRVSAALEADGRLHLVALGADQHTVDAWQVRPNTYWSDWTAGSPLPFRSGLALMRNPVPPDRPGDRAPTLEAYATALDGLTTWHSWQFEPNGSWSPWVPLP